MLSSSFNRYLRVFVSHSLTPSSMNLLTKHFTDIDKPDKTLSKEEYLQHAREADIIIDGGIGGVEPSTVVNCTEGEAEIVRQGKGWLEE